MAEFFEELLDEKQAAAALGVGASTLQHWRRDGHRPAYVRLGRKILYRKSDLVRHLDACTVDPEEDEDLIREAHLNL